MATVIVNKKTRLLKNGSVELQTTRDKVYKVKHIYDDGTLETSTGDVWKYKKFDGGEADFIALY